MNLILAKNINRKIKFLRLVFRESLYFLINKLLSSLDFVKDYTDQIKYESWKEVLRDSNEFIEADINEIIDTGKYKELIKSGEKLIEESKIYLTKNP